jgi:hypothetical protein
MLISRRPIAGAGTRCRKLPASSAMGAGSLHVAAGGYSMESKDKIISFRDRSAEKANGVCLNCHAKSDHVRNWFSGAHAAQDIKCSDCHTIHGEAHGKAGFEFPGEAPGIPRAIESRRQQNENCLRCHQKQNAEADLPYHHPIREAKRFAEPEHADCEPACALPAVSFRAPQRRELAVGRPVYQLP